MKKLIIFSLILILIFAGCSNNSIESLEDESIQTFDVSSKTEISSTTQGAQPSASVADSSGNTVPATGQGTNASTTQGLQTSSPVETTSGQATSIQQTSSANATLDEKFAKIDFYLVAGVYSREVLQDEIEITEMFTLDKTNFVRVASGEFEQEVFAYNYVSDNFTYLYYFDGEMVSKTVFNVDTGAILQDINGYSEYLKVDAEELKLYFEELIRTAGIEISEIS